MPHSIFATRRPAKFSIHLAPLAPTDIRKQCALPVLGEAGVESDVRIALARLAWSALHGEPVLLFITNDARRKGSSMPSIFFTSLSTVHNPEEEFLDILYTFIKPDADDARSRNRGAEPLRFLYR